MLPLLTLMACMVDHDMYHERQDALLDKDGDGFSITKVHLDTTVSIPDADHEAVTRIIAKAKENCPVSKLLSAEITLSQTLNPPQR